MNPQRQPYFLVVAYGFYRLFIRVFVCVAVLALLTEGVLRIAGRKPLKLETQLSATVPDHWTGWRMRPSVATGPEYVVTNGHGLHERREITLEKPAGKLRVAMLGSSVVYGIGLGFEQNLTFAVEQDLRKNGYDAEVINFGNHGFNAVNMSSLLQTYVHQYNPDVVVVVADVQVIYPKWPSVVPVSSDAGAIKQLSLVEGLLKKGAAHSALLTFVDSRWHATTEIPQLKAQAKKSEPVANAATAEAAAAPPSPTEAAWLAHRRNELKPILAAMASFCRERGIKLFFATPFGPYFQHTQEELKMFPLHVFAEANRVYGDNDTTIKKEITWVGSLIHEVAKEYDADVVDMLDESKRLVFSTNKYVSYDAIHLSPEGSAYFGNIISQQIMRKLGKKAPLANPAKGLSYVR